ncbi:MAG: YkvA family protein [Gammaproteobacteria bacterium]|jgi:uncharacterized membrane protein YkvA (DUF1232 family)
MQTAASIANSLQTNVYALYLASRDRRVPLLPKVLVGLVVAYALSPIDLIPDFIPVLGYLDDLLIVPLGVWLAIRLVPKDIWQECRLLAAERVAALPRNRRAAIVIVTIWLLAITSFLIWLGSVIK